MSAMAEKTPPMTISSPLHQETGLLRRSSANAAARQTSGKETGDASRLCCRSRPRAAVAGIEIVDDVDHRGDTITNWAMRSSGLMVKPAWPRFHRHTISSPW